MIRALGFFFFILFIASCSPSDQDDGRTVFRYNESAGITSLDPAFSRNLENMWAVNQLFDGLVVLDSSMRVQPHIAKQWSISEDGLTYSFTIRNDVHFHDHEVFAEGRGRLVVAADFVYSFNRIMSEQVASPGQWIFNKVDFDSGGFQAPNDSTLTVQLKETFPPFLSILSMQYCNVVPREIVEHYGADFRANPIGTGPFKFAFWYEGVALVYHKSESYWETDASGNALPYLDAIKIDFVRDMNNEFHGLVKGDYHFMSGINPEYKDELLDPAGDLSAAYNDIIRFQRTPFLKTDYIGILVDTSLTLSSTHPLSDPKLRRALNLGLNRADMVRYLRNNAVIPADHGFVPKGLPSFELTSGTGYSYDPTMASQLMEEAGYPGGKGLPEIALSTTSDYVDLCEFMQHEWEKLGFKISIDVLPSSVHRQNVSESKLLMFRKSWLADYADEENFLGLFYSGNFCPGGPNYTHFSSAEFDPLFELAASETNDSLRLDMYSKLDSIVVAESPVIPLFYDQVSHFVRKEVEGLPTNPINMLDLRKTRINRN